MPNGVIIGQVQDYYTWASLRTVFSNFDTTLNIEHNREYPVHQVGNFFNSYKSASLGSGLIRADSNSVFLGTFNFTIIGTNTVVNPSPPPTYISDWTLGLQWWDYSVNQTLVPVEVQTQLTGETVTLTAGSPFNITSDLFTVPYGDQAFLFLSPDPGYVSTIGKLTPIT